MISACCHSLKETDHLKLEPATTWSLGFCHISRSLLGFAFRDYWLFEILSFPLTDLIFVLWHQKLWRHSIKWHSIQHSCTSDAKKYSAKLINTKKYSLITEYSNCLPLLLIIMNEKKNQLTSVKKMIKYTSNKWLKVQPSHRFEKTYFYPITYIQNVSV